MSNGEVQGIDVSHYQGTVDWQQVRAAGVQFAFAKATEGVTLTDPEFATNWAGMKAAGLLRGAYHFFEPTDDAGQQAAFFLSTVPFESGDLPPVLDVETAAATSAELWQGVQTWLDQVEAATGMRPTLYLNSSFANENDAPASLAAYPLWLAQYEVDQPTVPNGWTTWLLWQYSQSGTVNGVSGSLDLDQLNGPLSGLSALAKA
ncbi:MAG TPA: glycoside hydrolase family 25 protein [Thermoanaerobaculia bacterium]|nr:glycoside hydrolase family 25 protein [Thermoanaerobaculia bacterium]